MDFELRETKKIVIHSLTVMPFDDFVRAALNSHQLVMMWCNGVLFQATALRETDDLLEAMRRGEEEHFFAVYATRMAEYGQVIDNQLAVTRVHSKVFDELTTWIKSRDEWSTRYNGKAN